MCLPSPVVYARDITRKSSHVKCQGLARGKQKEREGDIEVLQTPKDQKNTLSKDNKSHSLKITHVVLYFLVEMV